MYFLNWGNQIYMHNWEELDLIAHEEFLDN